MSLNHSISVVVTTYNRSETLIPVLRALSQQCDRQFDVVIADDGSNEEHQMAIRSIASDLSMPVAHVWHPDVGFTAGQARNRGVAAAQGNYIVFLDGDCVPETDFISQHRRLMEEGCFVNGSRVMLSPALSADVVSGRVVVSGQGWTFWLKNRLSGDASKLTGLLRLPDGGRRKQKTFVWRGIRSCNMGVWRHHFESVNGFDESFVGWGHEDADFVLRLHNFGVIRKNGYCATEVYHLWHKEANRSQESENAERVRERMVNGQVQPTVGYKESIEGSGVVVTRLR